MQLVSSTVYRKWQLSSGFTVFVMALFSLRILQHLCDPLLICFYAFQVTYVVQKCTGSWLRSAWKEAPPAGQEKYCITDWAVRDLKLLKSFHSHQLCSFSTSHRRIILQMLFLSIINTLSVNLKGIPFISQFSYAYTIFFPHLACTDTLMLDQGCTCSWFQDVFTRWGME